MNVRRKASVAADCWPGVIAQTVAMRLVKVSWSCFLTISLSNADAFSHLWPLSHKLLPSKATLRNGIWLEALKT